MVDNFSRLVQAIDPNARLIRKWVLTGGVSAQTVALEIERADGARARLVVRQHGPRDVARDPEIALHEFELLDALLRSGLPVPRPVQAFSTGEIFDGQAIVVEFIDGETVTDPPSPSRYISEMARWLGKIHQFDLGSHDLSFLVPANYDDGDRLEIQPDDSVLAQSICQVLSDTSRVEFRNAPVLLHGDFWCGNLLWKGEEIVGILDWEDAMVGDPILDLARSRLELHQTHGALGRERFTSHYLSWRDINVDTLAYWDLVMGLGFARAYTHWGLSPAREQEMGHMLRQFVHQATAQLSIDRS